MTHVKLILHLQFSRAYSSVKWATPRAPYSLFRDRKYVMDLLTAPMEVTKVDVVGVSVISLSLMYWFWSALKVVHVLH